MQRLVIFSHPGLVDELTYAVSQKRGKLLRLLGLGDQTALRRFHTWPVLPA